MITIRNAQDRGHFDHGWLNTYHTFSFADYYDPAHMGFRNLRVINEDRVLPARGFGTHPHCDMEIVTYILEGSLEHRDSMGNGSVIRPGEVQRMSAGTGVTHSEVNPSKTEPVHLLQIWLLPAERGIRPEYEQKQFLPAELEGRFRLVASPDGRDGSVVIHTDAALYAGRIGAAVTSELPLGAARHAWVQVARGKVRVNGHELKAGDGAALSGEPSILVEGIEASELLVFDLA